MIKLVWLIVMFGLLLYFAVSEGSYRSHFDRILNGIARNKHNHANGWHGIRSSTCRGHTTVGGGGQRLKARSKSRSSGSKGPAESLPEKTCREIFQRIFGERFQKVRPTFLKNPKTKRNLELDGFCPSIQTRLGYGLAFEFNGRQHAKFTPYFHSSEEKFIDQITRDAFKRRKCQQKGILLITVPHWVQVRELEGYIRDRLKQEGLLG